MPDIDAAIKELRIMDNLAGGDSVIHRIHPVTKFITTILFVLITMSFDKYNLSGLIVMILYPVTCFSLAGLSIQKSLYKMRFVLPLICFVGLFNPFFDKRILFYIGTIPVTGGFMSMLTVLVKGIICLLGTYLFVATTSMDSCCAGLRKLGVPNMIVALFLLTYRYVYVLIEELANMITAYKLRAPEHKGIHVSAWGSFLGQLLLRSMDRAEELYNSMELRGFKGDFKYASCKGADRIDYFYLIVMVGLFVLARYVNIAQLIGGLFVRG